MSSSDCIKKKEKKPVEVVVFQDPAKRRSKAEMAKDKEAALKSTSKDVIKRPFFDQKKAKYDIRKLAMTGMNKSEQEVAMADYLVDLGAKKARNKHVTIEEYMNDLKTKAKSDGLDEGKQSKDGLQQKGDTESKKTKYKRKRDKDDILGFVDGQIGTYKNGVQFIKTGVFGKKRRK